MNLPVDLKRRVMEAAQELPSPVRSRARREARFVTQCAVVVALGLFFALDGVRHAAGRPSWFLAASLAVWAAVATGAMCVAWRRGASFTAGSVAWLAVIALGTPIVLLAVSLAFAWRHPELALLHAERVGLKCFVLTLAAGAGPLVGLSLVRRSSDPMHPLASGAALGVASGAFAGVMVVLWCPVAAPAHVAIGHVLPIAVLAMIGTLLGHHVIAMRVSRC